MSCYNVSEANTRCKGCVRSASRSLPVLSDPEGRGGWELRARLQTLHACVTVGLGTRLSPPWGEAMAQQSRARSHRSDSAPGREGAPTPLTMLAGEEGGSGELALGLRTRLARTVQVMVPAGSGSPPPMQRQPPPHPGHAGTLYKERGPPARLIGDPRNNSSRPTHPSARKLKKQEMGLGGRRGEQRLGAPRPGPTPSGRLRAQAGAPRPPRSEAAVGPTPRLKGRRLKGPRRRSPSGRLKGKARGPELSLPP